MIANSADNAKDPGLEEEQRDADQPHVMSHRFQILSLDGGGLKGLFAAAVLARFEEDLGTTITDHFDLLSGTSTGGLIALALGKGMMPAEIVDVYGRLGRDVFGRRRRGPLRLFRPRYAADRLRDALDEIFGETRLCDSIRPLVIPCYSLTGNDVWLYKTPHMSRFTRDPTARMADVALATAAAPTFLPVARIGDNRFVDGGIWANSPLLVAIAEAHSSFDIDLADIRLLSLGTTSEVIAPSRLLDRGGLVAWAVHGPDLFLRAQALGGFHTAEHLLRRDHGRLIRIDAHVPKGLFRLDRVDPSAIRGQAEFISRQESERVTPFITEHVAPPFVPANKKGVSTP